MKNVGILVVIIISIVYVTTVFAESDLRCGTQEAFERFKSGEGRLRPTNGPKYIYTPHFVIHFDTTGTHACTRAYAESTAIYAEFCWEKQVGGLGWAAPPPDTGGPDSRYDIYIQNISYYGQNFWESPYPDPYPTGVTSYILIRNSMSWVDLRGTVAHEFNHACQGRYSSQYLWWYENVATWMDVICTEDVSWVVWCLSTSPNPLWNPNLSIENTTNRYEYAGYLWARFLHEYYGISCMRLIWEKIGQIGGYHTLTAIDSVMQYYDSNLKLALGNYAIWRYFTGDRADTIDHFSESYLYPTSYVDPHHQHSGPGSGNQGAYDLDGPGGTSFIEFYTTADYMLKSSFAGGTGGGWQVWNIGYSPPTGHRQYMMDSLDYWSSLPTTEHDTIVLIPTVTATASGFSYEYSGVGISSTPPPPQDPELEICFILSPIDTIFPYNSITPYAVRRNNATSTAIDTTWISFYVGDLYGESRKIDQLGPGQTDTVSFSDWTASERSSLNVRCVGGGAYDEALTNNCCDTSTFVPLSDFDVLEILSPRGVVALDDTIEPRVLLRNNGTSSSNIFVSFTIENYADTNSIYLGPDSCGELSFDNWMPVQLGMCTTSCLITEPDQRPCNDILAGEVLVDSIMAIQENQTYEVIVLQMQARPNPFHHQTDIRCQITDNSKNAKLTIYDVTGRLVKSFPLPTSYSSYAASVVWDGTDLTSRPLPSGVYFLRVEAGDCSATEKLLLIR